MKTHVLMAAAVLPLAAPTVLAHHSNAMFDADKRLLLEGTVKEAHWTNPHAWLQIMIPSPDGGEIEWSIIMSAANAMYRAGWKRNTLSPGDKLEVMVRPLKDGRPGGLYVNSTLSDGTKMGRHEDANGNPITPNVTLREYYSASGR